MQTSLKPFVSLNYTDAFSRNNHIDKRTLTVKDAPLGSGLIVILIGAKY